MAIEIVEDRLMAQMAADTWMNGNAVHGRTEHELAGWIGETQRTNAHPIDGQQAASALQVDERNGKRSPNIPQTVATPASVGFRQRCRATLVGGKGFEL